MDAAGQNDLSELTVAVEAMMNSATPHKLRLEAYQVSTLDAHTDHYTKHTRHVLVEGGGQVDDCAGLSHAVA